MSSEQAKQYHSITFGDKNTWDDWHLVPSTRPVFLPPETHTNFVDIPGADGSLDISDALRGFPTYKNREGSFEFYVLRPDGYIWHSVYSKVMNYLHGKKMRAILDDDPGYFYEGRFFVENWSSDADYSHITIKYNVLPYKMSIASSSEDWLWDTFSFEDGIIPIALLRDIRVESSEEWTEKILPASLFDDKPICPKFIVSTPSGDGMDMRFSNGTSDNILEAHLKNGSNMLYDIIIFGDEGCTVSFKGAGTVTIDFRNGRL